MALATGVLAATGNIVRQISVAVTSLEARSEAQAEAGLILVRMRSELSSARCILSLSARKIVFVHPDVTGDSRPDVITYEWSGTAGDDLTRAVNSDMGEGLLANCQSFVITDIRGTATEELLAGHEAYEPSISAMSQQYSAGATAPAAEIFTVGSSGGKFQVTRVQLELEPLTPGGAGNLSVSLVAASGGTPGPTPIETFTEPIAQMCSSGWQEFRFAGSTGLTLGTPYALVIRPSGTSVVLAYHDTIVSGETGTPNDYFRWSSNGGSSWPVISNMGSRDLRYKVYGRYVDMGGQPLPIQNAPVSLLEIHLEAGSGSARVQLDSAIECINSPEVQP